MNDEKPEAKPEFTLVVPSYMDPVEARLGEAATCLEKNLANEFISGVHIIIEDPVAEYRAKLKAPTNPNMARLAKLLGDPRVVLVERGERVTHKSMIEYVNKELAGKQAIYANTDVYFDETLGLIYPRHLKRAFLCMAKYNGEVLHSPMNSQDAWILIPPVPQFAEPWLFGPPGNDNRVAFEAKEAGLLVMNPAHSVKVHHLHASAVRRHHQGERYWGGYYDANPCHMEDLEREQKAREAEEGAEA